MVDVVWFWCVGVTYHGWLTLLFFVCKFLLISFDIVFGPFFKNWRKTILGRVSSKIELEGECRQIIELIL